MAAKKTAAASAAPTVLKLKLTSRRAPYTRGGVKFTSNRQPVILGEDEITTDQIVKIVADQAISIALVDPASGLSVPLPADLFDAEGRADQNRLADLAEGLLKAVAEAGEPAPEAPKEGDDA